MKKLFKKMPVLWAFLAIFTLAAPTMADCPDGHVRCWGPHPDTGEYTVDLGTITVGMCYQWKYAECEPCLEKTGKFCDYCNKCNQTYPNGCKGKCRASWKGIWYKLKCPSNWNPPKY